MFPKTQIIVNPESDGGRTGGRWKHIKEVIKIFLKDYKCEFTEKPRQATEISRTAIKEGSELIVGVGGDGTINEIANGFYENRKLINSETALGVIPSGSGCDFSKSLKIPSGFRKAMEIITQVSPSLIDIGKIRFINHEGNKEERFFLNIADFGIGGEVVKRMNQNRTTRRTSSYLRSLIITFLNYKDKKLRIKIDGKEIPVENYMIGAISNGRIFGRGMKIAPHALLNDGLFDVVLIKGMKIIEFLRNGWKIYLGSHLSHPKVSLIQGKKIEVLHESDEKNVLIEVDGEQVGRLPATFEIMPRNFLVKGYI